LSSERKPKMTVTRNLDDSITFRIDTSDGPASITFRPDGTKITHIPTPTGVKVIITPGKGKGKNERANPEPSR